MSVSEWIEKITEFASPIKEQFEKIYGLDPYLLSDRQKAILSVLSEFRDRFGDNKNNKLVLIRSPARINLKGVHIEHRGGFVNYLTHRREILLVARARQDDKVVLHNVNSDLFPDREFSIQEELKRGDWRNWLDYINAPEVRKTVSMFQGDWMNYVKGAILRLQSRFPDNQFCGLDMCISGDIPIGAGLSSSAALVVVTAYAVLLFNRLTLDKEELIELCGDGEWYVGTRGGAGDHAAMILGMRDYIAHMQFFPLRVEFYPFPKGYRVVICNSLKQATKSANARDVFNARITAYEIALLLIKKQYPQYAPKLTRLRDVSAENLGISEAEIYRIIRSLPEKITREQAYELLPEHNKYLENFFALHKDPPEGYRIRDVCLFGLAECERSKICVEFLSEDKLFKFGELMYISHNGDRIVQYDEQNNKLPWDNYITDEKLDQLIADAESDDPDRIARSKLYRQPGGYRCSTEELDFIVDISSRVPGVLGAGLTGAGLGGCVLVLIEENQIDKLFDTLRKEYYSPRGLPFGAEVCISVAGAGTIIINH